MALLVGFYYGGLRTPPPPPISPWEIQLQSTFLRFVGTYHCLQEKWSLILHEYWSQCWQRDRTTAAAKLAALQWMIFVTLHLNWPRHTYTWHTLTNTFMQTHTYTRHVHIHKTCTHTHAHIHIQTQTHKHTPTHTFQCCIVYIQIFKLKSAVLNTALCWIGLMRLPCTILTWPTLT